MRTLSRANKLCLKSAKQSLDYVKILLCNQLTSMYVFGVMLYLKLHVSRKKFFIACKNWEKWKLQKATVQSLQQYLIANIMF